MSRTFSTNGGSVEGLKVSTRCGFRAKAHQMRQTAVWLRPVALARERVLQCVGPEHVASSGYVGSLPGNGESGNKPRTRPTSTTWAV